MNIGRRTVALFGACALLTLTLFAASSPQSIGSVSVSGNSAFTSAEILRWLSSTPGSPYSDTTFQADLDRIRDHYRKAGFLGVVVAGETVPHPADTTSINLTVAVREGKRTVVGRIRLEGLRSLTESDALRLFDTEPGNPLSDAALAEDCFRLIRELESRGYPLARCRVDSVEWLRGESEDSLAIRVAVDPGPAVQISEVRVEGNRETNADVILREMRLREGEPYDPVRVEALRQRLVRLNIFSSVSEPELFLRGDTAGLLVRVQEGRTNTFDGILGYIPGSVSGEKGYFTGLVSVGMRNLFGTGRKLSLQWKRENRYTQELGVRYTEPWIFGFPVNVAGGFFQRQQDTAYVRRLVDGRADLLLSEKLSLGVSLGSEAVIPNEDTTIGRAYRSSSLSLGADAVYDSRDDLYAPTTGVRYVASYQYGRKTIDRPGFPPSGWVQRLGVDVEIFLPAFARQVVALSVHGRQVQGTEIQEAEMYLLGGTRSLRGYRESQFSGTLVSWFNSEYRFLTGRRSYLFALFDLGYYSRPEFLGSPAAESVRFGYGIGATVDTAIGMIGVSVALGKGDSLSDAKIHIGIINDF